MDFQDFSKRNTAKGCLAVPSATDFAVFHWVLGKKGCKVVVKTEVFQGKKTSSFFMGDVWKPKKSPSFDGFSAFPLANLMVIKKDWPRIASTSCRRWGSASRWNYCPQRCPPKSEDVYSRTRFGVWWRGVANGCAALKTTPRKKRVVHNKDSSYLGSVQHPLSLQVRTPEDGMMMKPWNLDTSQFIQLFLDLRFHRFSFFFGNV